MNSGKKMCCYWKQRETNMKDENGEWGLKNSWLNEDEERICNEEDMSVN